MAERFVVESESQLESNPDTGRMDRDQWPKDRRIRLTRSPLTHILDSDAGGREKQKTGGSGSSPPLSLLAAFDILSVVTVCLSWDTCLFSLVFLPALCLKTGPSPGAMLD